MWDRLLERAAIVMAHPDDEVLWASSILARVERILLCYEDIPFQPAISEGRRQALARFPLPNVASLRLEEAASYGSAAWFAPVETEYGLQLRQGPGSMRGFSAERYRTQFAVLKDLLRARLGDCRNVITHNPWGEYGHEDHVQVFRAVTALQAELGYAVWVSGYCSDRSAGLMLRSLGGLGAPTPALPTDPDLAAALMALYRETGCWTWFDDYRWPDREVFYPWLGGPGNPPEPGRVHPMNLVWAPPLPLRPAARRPRPIAWLARRLPRRSRGS
jgi:LmbE family N-acetylglucosaminyl deacetylase